MSEHDKDAHDDDVMTSDEFADVRAALSLAVPPVALSAGIKQAVMATIAVTPQLAPLSAVAPVAATPTTSLEVAAPDAAAAATPHSAIARAQARWFSRPATLVVAAAAAAALFFGGVLVGDLTRSGASDDTQQLAALVAASDVSTVVSPVTGGATATLVSSEIAGLSALVFDGLQPLTADERYALWYITDGVATPAGLFAIDGASEGAVVHVLEGTFETGTTVGVSVEPESGSPAPTTVPILQIATS